MNTKTTAILTFVVTVVVPFLQEVSDFITAFRGSVPDSRSSSILRETGFEVSQDLKNSVENQPQNVESYIQTVAAKDTSKSGNAWSRFFNNKR